MFSVEKLPYAETWQDDEYVQEKEQSALRYFEKIIKEKGHIIAALIIKPLIQGAGGMRLCRAGFMHQIVTMAEDNNILVIFGLLLVLVAQDQCLLVKKLVARLI